MKAFLVAALLVCVLTPPSIRAADITTSDVVGNWKTSSTTAATPKTFREVFFSLRIDEEGIKGGVLMGNFPGYATVTGGRIEGERIFFSAVKVFFSTEGGRKTSDLHLQFTGTIHNGLLNVTVLDDKGIWGAKGINLEGRKLP